MDTARLVGEQIDQYKILSHIERGGMADVYLAEDVTLKRKVAFKVMLDVLATDPQYVARFQREAQTVAQVDHPNIVQVYSTGLTPLGQPYIAMQYIDGGSLGDKLKILGQKGKLLTTEQSLNIVRQLALALSVAHNARIVHRDLKPSNVLIRSDGTPVLVDLGIAAVADKSKLTMTGGIMGTPQYMSPEQVQGKALDGRSDIYSLGIMLYEMLAGRRPFEGDHSVAIMHQQVYEQPPPLYKRRSDLTNQTLYIVETCLQKSPETRFQSAEEMIQAIDQALMAEEGHGPNPQMTEVLTYLPDSSLVSRRQVIQDLTPTGLTSRLPVPLWLIATLGMCVCGVFVILLIYGLNSFNGETLGAVDRTATSSAITRVITQVVTQTRDQNGQAEEGATPESVAVQNTPEPATSDNTTVSESESPAPGEEATSTTAPVPTETPEPTDPPPPTFTLPPPPTATPPPPPTPIPTTCAFSVLSTFSSAYSSHQSVLGCPVNVGGTIFMAEESFQNGLMLWREDNDRIYVLYNSGSWASYADTWTESMSEFTCGTSQSPPTPKRGFGKVWCDNNLQGSLGNATSAESGADGAAQDYSGGQIIRSGGGRTYILYSNGSWR